MIVADGLQDGSDLAPGHGIDLEAMQTLEILQQIPLDRRQGGWPQLLGLIFEELLGHGPEGVGGGRGEPCRLLVALRIFTVGDLAKIFFATLSACSRVSLATEPIVLRRCCAPSLYCTI